MLKAQVSLTKKMEEISAAVIYNPIPGPSAAYAIAPPGYRSMRYLEPIQICFACLETLVSFAQPGASTLGILDTRSEFNTFTNP